MTHADATPPSVGVPLSVRACDAAVVGFGVWTLCAHAAVAAGGTLDRLMLAYVAALLAVAAGVFAVQRRRRAGAPTTRAAGAATGPGSLLPERARSAIWLALLALGLVGVAGLVSGLGLPVQRWWLVTALLSAAAVPFVLLEAPEVTPPHRSRAAELALLGLAAAAVVVTMLCHRPDIDDAFYINVSVAAADFADRALLSDDTLLGVEGLPLHMPAHRLHTYELANGALARLTGIPAIYVAHWLAAGLAAAFVPLAFARLSRRLTPGVWPWTVAAVIAVLVACGETHRWYGNFAFARMWQGKAIFLFVFMPLVYAHALEFALRPSAPRWLLLALAQIAALGCSSSAVWVAPAGALATLACALRPGWAGLRTFALGASASAYVLAAGLTLKGDVSSTVSQLIGTADFGDRLAASLQIVLGDGALKLASLAALLIAWAAAPAGLGRRFAIVVPLATWVVVLSPYWDAFISSNVTGPSYWRAMWSLPIPLLLALVLVAPLQLRARIGTVASSALCAALVGWFAFAVPSYSIFSQHNKGVGVGIRVGWPGLKVPAEAYEQAAALHAAVPAGSAVIAPPDVGVWLPTFHGSVYPLQVRKLYLARQSHNLAPGEAERRHWLSRYVAGQVGGRRSGLRFRSGLARFEIDGVLLRDSAKARAARRVLIGAGFGRAARSGDYEIWVRGPGRSPARDAPDALDATG